MNFDFDFNLDGLRSRARGHIFGKTSWRKDLLALGAGLALGYARALSTIPVEPPTPEQIACVEAFSTQQSASGRPASLQTVLTAFEYCGVSPRGLTASIGR